MNITNKITREYFDSLLLEFRLMDGIIPLQNLTCMERHFLHRL